MLCLFAIFLVDSCGSPARDNCTHYLCWTNSTCCDSRSYRLSGGRWAFTFLVGGLFRVKPQLAYEDFTPKEYNPSPAFQWWKFVSIQRSPNGLWSLLLCICVLDYNGGALGGKGVFYLSNVLNPHVSTKLCLVLFQKCPTSSHTNPFQGNPMKKCTKKPGNKTINSKRVLQPHTDPFPGNPMGKCTKKTWAYPRQVKRTLFHHSRSLCKMSQQYASLQTANKHILLGNCKVSCF
jgi:hypothetical protein